MDQFTPMRFIYTHGSFYIDAINRDGWFFLLIRCYTNLWIICRFRCLLWKVVLSKDARLIVLYGSFLIYGFVAITGSVNQHGVNIDSRFFSSCCVYCCIRIISAPMMLLCLKILCYTLVLMFPFGSFIIIDVYSAFWFFFNELCLLRIADLLLHLSFIFVYGSFLINGVCLSHWFF